jgi:electron transfer flavoprotein alpha subunit
METVLFLSPVESDGSLSKASLEALAAAKATADGLGAPLALGLWGEGTESAFASIASTQPTACFAVEGAEFAPSRYASDAAAAEALCRAAGPGIIIAPGTARTSRTLPGTAHRLGGRADTHVTALQTTGGRLSASRWYYRQRMEAVFDRAERPWLIILDPGCTAPWKAETNSGSAPAVTRIEVSVPEEAKKTRVAGIEAPPADEQTIRPEADLLFVAGAGWTKKQADGKPHVEDAERLILGILRTAKASLGSTKSLVDLSGEGQAVLRFMTHMNQVGQTGSTPRHAKGLATCCHGEEPHVVGWRFIGERRAVNLDPNCGWARGKANVLYVADAFQVMAKVNELLAEK